jgi:hypothetical protein
MLDMSQQSKPEPSGSSAQIHAVQSALSLHAVQHLVISCVVSEFVPELCT